MKEELNKRDFENMNFFLNGQDQTSVWDTHLSDQSIQKHKKLIPTAVTLERGTGLVGVEHTKGFGIAKKVLMLDLSGGYKGFSLKITH